jgi:acyl carrier protein
MTNMDISNNPNREIYEQVKGLIVEILCVKDEAISLKSRFIEDLGADSLDMVALLMAFEEEFNRTILSISHKTTH